MLSCSWFIWFQSGFICVQPIIVASVAAFWEKGCVQWMLSPMTHKGDWPAQVLCVFGLFGSVEGCKEERMHLKGSTAGSWNSLKGSTATTKEGIKNGTYPHNTLPPQASDMDTWWGSTIHVTYVQTRRFSTCCVLWLNDFTEFHRFWLWFYNNKK